MKTLYLLWDDSHIWGLLAARALEAMEVPWRPVRGREIAAGLLERERPALVLVPGGNARHKAESLGSKGLCSIRRYVAGGGSYLGFCGGAGLALSWKGEAKNGEQEVEGLAICPWKRGRFDDRMQHFMSGHLYAALSGQEGCRDLLPPLREQAENPMPVIPADGRRCRAGAENLPDLPDRAPSGSSCMPESMPKKGAAGADRQDPVVGPGRPVQGRAVNRLDPQPSEQSVPRENVLLPVWWPGRFALAPQDSVTVLASYAGPARDFWLADLPVADLPADIFSAWQDLYGLSFSPSFLAGQPCVIHGHHGQGQYLLSYSHLETPDSPQANAWLARILHVLGAVLPVRESVPPWNPDQEPVRWEQRELVVMERRLQDLIEAGLKHGLLFIRTPWLLGWRTGIPGAHLNNVRTVLRSIQTLPPTGAASAFMKKRGSGLQEAMELFVQGCMQYLLAERLAQTLSRTMPDAVPASLLKRQREALFGEPMQAGGLYKDVMEPLDALLFLQLSGQPKRDGLA